MESLLKELFEQLEEERRRVDLCLEKLSEERIWKRPREGNNSIGNLCLHLTGNESHYVGHCVGGDDYVRDRPHEFNATGGYSAAELSGRLARARDTTRRVFDGLSAADFSKVVESDLPHDSTALRVMLHVTHHYAYHTGQVILLTRLWQDNSERILEWGH